jgi:tRNA pseudouridine13 synthase
MIPEDLLPTPAKLPLLSSAPRPRVAVKSEPGDFIVEELPLYEPSGTGTHTWLWIEKRDLTTHAAARQLAEKLGKNPKDAGVAGLKDAHAVTRQWISFEGVRVPEADLRAIAGPNLTVLNVTHHGNKLKMGHLRANRFTIRVRPESPADAATIFAPAQAALANLERLGIPNYFGEQRFGNFGDNAAFGKLLVQGKVKEFQAEMTARGAGRNAGDRRIRNLLVNAFQSELFNRVAAARMPELGRLLPGDLAYLHRNGAVFAVLEAHLAAEQTRADAHETSPSGPLFGPSMKAPTGAALAIETEILAAAGVTREDFGRKEAERQPGARRALRVFFVEPPALTQDGDALTLRFALPSGSYATVVLRELFEYE